MHRNRSSGVPLLGLIPPDSLVAKPGVRIHVGGWRERSSAHMDARILHPRGRRVGRGSREETSLNPATAMTLGAVIGLFLIFRAP